MQRVNDYFCSTAKRRVFEKVRPVRFVNDEGDIAFATVSRYLGDIAVRTAVIDAYRQCAGELGAMPLQQTDERFLIDMRPNIPFFVP